MKLEIPDTYTVKKGDTLYSIARDNHVALDSLLSLNRIDKAYVIRIGQILVLPQGASPLQSIAENSDGSTGSTSGTSQAVSSAGASQGVGQTIGPGSSSSPFWPAPGRRVFLTGKLSGGTQISGGVGDPVYAVAPGRVVWVGPYRGYGRVVFVESPTSYIYVYGGNETTLVKVGDTVAPGAELANMGINPHLGQACAYFFVYKNGRPVDPKSAPRG
jgi:murein DD-endopeptidase MepM/ murein hydrolase activator NlpD